jgi:hypothetical protein
MCKSVLNSIFFFELSQKMDCPHSVTSLTWNQVSLKCVNFGLTFYYNLHTRGEHRNRVPAFGTGTALEPPVPEPEPM